MTTLRTLSRALAIRFDLPECSSDGGLLLLRKVDEELGLTRKMASCLQNPVKGKKLLAQRVYGIAMGWEDCNDFDRLKEDPLYKLVLGEKPGSQPTLSRFENSVRARHLHGLSETLANLFVDRHRRNPPKRIVVDMDATEDPAHGQREFEFYHGFYGKHCFLPLLVFCSADSGDEELVGAILRPGNVHAGRRSAAILRRLVEILRRAFPHVGLLFRADGGFALPEIYETCEESKISYLVSLPKNERLLRAASPLMTEAKSEYEKANTENTGEKVKRFGEVFYAAGSWTKERRVVVKAEILEKGENPRFVLTDLAGEPETLYAEYCKRGDCENRIKELKLDLLSGRTSCHRFSANAFRLLLHAMAFVLLSNVKAKLALTSLARAAVGQIRLKLLKIAAQVQATIRRILVHMPRGHPNAGLLQTLLA